jgi:hypothetical protein
MKTRLLLLIVSISAGNFVAIAEPAHAIFGLSKCEKIVKQIKQEEEIGYVFWKDFDEARDGVARKASMQLAGEAFLLLDPLLDSNIRVIDLAEKNPSCFSAKKLATARKSKLSNLSLAKTFAQLRTNLANNPAYKDVVVTDSIWQALLATYPKFTSFLELKK